MKIATWNVNSIKVRLEHLIKWLELRSIDAVVIQETKTVDELFPLAQLQAAGFDAVFLGQKTYNGVALVTRKSTVKTVKNVVYNIPGYPDEQKRMIAADIEHVSGVKLRFAGVYVPNGTELGGPRYLYKLDWMSALSLWVQECIQTNVPLVLAGDFNVAPTDADVWNPEEWKGNLLVSEPERDAFQRLLKAGLVDTWSLGLHAPDTYSWWDYRQAGFEKNHGLRIDHILASSAVADRITDVLVDIEPRGWDKPSDHAPVVAEIL